MAAQKQKHTAKVEAEPRSLQVKISENMFRHVKMEAARLGLTMSATVDSMLTRLKEGA